jgi:hypothetical protein
MRPARAFAMRLTDEVASTGDWSGAAGVAAGVVGARRRDALRWLPGAGSGGGASAGVGSGAGSGAAPAPPDRRLRAPRRAVVPGSGSAGAASAGVIFLCFLLAILWLLRAVLECNQCSGARRGRLPGSLREML